MLIRNLGALQRKLVVENLIGGEEKVFDDEVFCFVFIIFF